MIDRPTAPIRHTLQNRIPYRRIHHLVLVFIAIMCVEYQTQLRRLGRLAHFNDEHLNKIFQFPL
jgi:hypothetical protein